MSDRTSSRSRPLTAVRSTSRRERVRKTEQVRKPETVQSRARAALTRMSGSLRDGLIYTPGIVIFAFGLSILLFPRAILLLVAILFFALGAMLCYVAWKASKLMKAVSRLSREFEGKISIQTIGLKSALSAL